MFFNQRRTLSKRRYDAFMEQEQEFKEIANTANTTKANKSTPALWSEVFCSTERMRLSWWTEGRLSHHVKKHRTVQSVNGTIDMMKSCERLEVLDIHPWQDSFVPYFKEWSDRHVIIERCKIHWSQWTEQTVLFLQSLNIRTISIMGQQRSNSNDPYSVTDILHFWKLASQLRGKTIQFFQTDFLPNFDQGLEGFYLFLETSLAFKIQVFLDEPVLSCSFLPLCQKHLKAPMSNAADVAESKTATTPKTDISGASTVRHEGISRSIQSLHVYFSYLSLQNLTHSLFRQWTCFGFQCPDVQMNALQHGYDYSFKSIERSSLYLPGKTVHSNLNLNQLYRPLVQWEQSSFYIYSYYLSDLLSDDILHLLTSFTESS